MPEKYLIDHCSPTLAGLKTANMFPISLDEGQDICDELRRLNRLLRGKGIRIVMLRRGDHNALLYLYRPDYLHRDRACSRISAGVCQVLHEGFTMRCEMHRVLESIWERGGSEKNIFKI